jgi:hypothetical protein
MLNNKKSTGVFSTEYKSNIGSTACSNSNDWIYWILEQFYGFILDVRL